jgi:opacity protein-like surface antigen
MKKSVFLLVGILAQSFLFDAFANNCSNPYKSHNFYLGTSLGVGFFNHKQSDQFTSNTPFKHNLRQNKSQISNYNLMGSGLIGYLYKINNFGVGCDLDWQKTNLEKKTSDKFDEAGVQNFDVHNNLKINNKFSISLKFGMFSNIFFSYLLIGASHAKINFNSLAYGSVGGNPNSSETYSFSKKLNGLKLGLGVQKKINQNWALGLELATEKFGKINYHFIFDKDPAGSNSQQHSTIRNLNIYSANLRLMYIF